MIRDQCTWVLRLKLHLTRHPKDRHVDLLIQHPSLGNTRLILISSVLMKLVA
jgi:hypothetical protein